MEEAVHPSAVYANGPRCRRRCGWRKLYIQALYTQTVRDAEGPAAKVDEGWAVNYRYEKISSTYIVELIRLELYCRAFLALSKGANSYAVHNSSLLQNVLQTLS